MKQNKTPISFFRFQKFFLLFLAAVLISFSPLKAKPVNAWDAIPGAIFKQAEEEISTFIKGTMIGSLKQAAIKTVSKAMDRFISGVSGNGARFITDWKGYLVNEPTRKAKSYANDYISRAFSGKGLSSSYKSITGSVLGASTMADEGFGARVLAAITDCTISGTTEGTDCTTTAGTPGTCQYVGGSPTLSCSSSSSTTPSRNYAQEMKDMVQDQVIEPIEWQLTYDGDPTKILEEKTLGNYNLFVLGDNMAADIKRNTSNILEKAYQEEKDEATAMSIANNGYKSSGEEDGLITKPGALIKEIQAGIEDLPNKAMAAAASIPEVIAATVSKAISGLTQSAVDGVQRAVDKQINSVVDKATKQVNSQVNKLGPSALFK